MCQMNDPLAVLLIGLVILALVAYAIIEYLDSGPSFIEIDIMHKLNCDRKTARKYLSKR